MIILACYLMIGFSFATFCFISAGNDRYMSLPYKLGIFFTVMMLWPLMIVVGLLNE